MCRTQRGWGAPHPEARRPVGLPSQDPCSSRKQRRQEKPRKAWGLQVLVPKPGQTAVLPAVSTAPPPSETTSAQLKHGQTRSWSVIAFWTPGKKGLSYTDTPRQQPKATFTSDLQIQGLCLRLLLVPEVAWPEMKLAYSFGELSNPRGHQGAHLCKCFLPASSKSRVAEPGHEGRGRTHLPMAPMEREGAGG